MIRYLRLPYQGTLFSISVRSTYLKVLGFYPNSKITCSVLVTDPVRCKANAISNQVDCLKTQAIESAKSAPGTCNVPRFNASHQIRYQLNPSMACLPDSTSARAQHHESHDRMRISRCLQRAPTSFHLLLSSRFPLGPSVLTTTGLNLFADSAPCAESLQSSLYLLSGVVRILPELWRLEAQR